MHEEEARSERCGLLVGLLREPVAAHSLGKAKVIADERTRPCLSTNAPRVQYQDAQPLRGAVDGRGKPRRSGADDHDVIRTLLDCGRRPGGLGDLGVRWIA